MTTARVLDTDKKPPSTDTALSLVLAVPELDREPEDV